MKIYDIEIKQIKPELIQVKAKNIKEAKNKAFAMYYTSRNKYALSKKNK